MGKNGVRLIVLLVALLGVGLIVQQVELRRARAARDRADFDAGLAAGRVIREAFAKDVSLRVARLTGEVLGQGTCTSGYVFADQQRTIAPFAASYYVDLHGVGPAALRWDAADHVMFVDVPDVVAEPATIDIAQARSRQTGLFISRTCGLALQRQIAGRLQAIAGERAALPAHLSQARESARAAIAGLVRAPLVAAGLDRVDVRVRFPPDARPVGDRQWDVSRSLDDVLHNRF